MSRRDGEKNWLEDVLSHVTQPLWGGQPLSEEDIADMKRYAADPDKYVRDAQANIVNAALGHANEEAMKDLERAKAQQDADREQRERDQDSI
jgi:hypothetical protein